MTEAPCVCCSKSMRPREVKEVHKWWDARLDGYCYNCASTRCDALGAHYSPSQRADSSAPTEPS